MIYVVLIALFGLFALINGRMERAAHAERWQRDLAASLKELQRNPTLSTADQRKADKAAERAERKAANARISAQIKAGTF